LVKISTYFWFPAGADFFGISSRSLASENYRVLTLFCGVVYLILHYMGFDSTPTCVRQTDRQTDKAQHIPRSLA